MVTYRRGPRLGQASGLATSWPGLSLVGPACHKTGRPIVGEAGPDTGSAPQSGARGVTGPVGPRRRLAGAAEIIAHLRATRDERRVPVKT